MSAYTETEIISLSLMLLGHKPIISLDNPDDMTIAAQQALRILLPSILSRGNWRFSITINQLSLSPIIPDPNTGWQNVYYLPSGWLKTIRVIPNNYVWEIYNNELIYCNWGTQSPVYMEYAYVPPINMLPASFINYLIYEIALFPALTNAQKPEYFQVLESERNYQMAIAAAADAQNRPQFAQVDIPMLNKRNITGIIGPQIG